MFRTLFNARYTQLMIVAPKGDTLDKYGERIAKADIERIPCIADGRQSSVQGDKGERFNISYSVQLSKTPTIFTGDTIKEVKTVQGDTLFTNGLVRRVTNLIDGKLGIVSQNLSIEVKS